MADVMVIAPHPDDESIGCGGAICLHRQKGQSVHVVFLTSGELGLKDLPREKAWEVREEEARRAAEVLRLTGLTFLRLSDWFLSDGAEEAANLLRPYLQREKPKLLYFPHAEEWHPDHSAVLPIVQAALTNGGDIPVEFLAYEVWTPLAKYDRVENITAVMGSKLRAVACYGSQTKQFRYDRAVRGLNQYRGALAAHCRYAEVFRRFQLELGSSGELTTLD
jgi:N-acetylglucosamine malate deacetylase 1